MALLGKKLISSAKNFVYFFALSVLFSCSSIYPLTKAEQDRLDNDIIDPNAQLTREQFTEALIPFRQNKYNQKRRDGSDFDKASKKRSMNSDYMEDEYVPSMYNEPAIPETSSILTTPIPSSPVTDKLISISVTEDIPLKDVLIELARLADVDMEIDPRISGGIILRVKDKPFDEVIERVVDLGGLRYKMRKGIIRVERDTAYKHDYKVDYLNITRSSESSINVDTQGLGGSDSELPSGSASSTTQSSEADVWASVEEALNNILSFTQESNMLSTQAEFETSDSESNSTIQVNRQAGLISVIATERQHLSIKEYLEKVEEQISSQVLIEAKVVEVTLDEQYKSGVDWGTLSDDNFGFRVSGNFDASIGNTADFFTISADNGGTSSLSSAISFTEKFGIARTISSPRLHAMNNQQAVLSFAENSVFFNLQVEEETDDSGLGGNVTTLTVESELQTVPVGVILTLQPSINMQTKEITMHVRPTLSRITGTVNDPGVEIIVARQQGNNALDIESPIPVVEVRELDSILKIKSGEIMVIGGLMQDIQSSEDKGVPFFNRAPIVGNLFKSKSQITETVETVIFIKATIIGNNDSRSIDKHDKRYYETFAPRDPRPLAF